MMNNGDELKVMLILFLGRYTVGMWVMLPLFSEVHAFSIFRVKVCRLVSFENDGGKEEIEWGLAGDF
jgi:hypothetical protein